MNSRGLCKSRSPHTMKGKIIMRTYKDPIKQAAFENAYDCLYYGYGKSYWNSCGLSESDAKKVWKKAFETICEEE